MSEMKIITFTEPRTGSTLVSNIINGFFEHSLPISFFNYKKLDLANDIFISNRITFKTHGYEYKYKTMSVEDQINILLNKKFPREVYFVYINRFKTYKKNHPRVIVLEYDSLLYKSNYSSKSKITLEIVIDYVAKSCTEKIDIEINDEMKQHAINRVSQMDILYEQIKDKPFKYFDKFYHIHGSHRNRKKHDQ